MALEVDINALGAPSILENGSSANGVAARKSVPTKKVVPAGTGRSAAPAARGGAAGGGRGRAASGKPAERRDPAREMRERQLAQEDVVSLFCCTPGHAKEMQGEGVLWPPLNGSVSRGEVCAHKDQDTYLWMLFPHK